jgi:hypothetical protein
VLLRSGRALQLACDELADTMARVAPEIPLSYAIATCSARLDPTLLAWAYDTLSLRPTVTLELLALRPDLPAELALLLLADARRPQHARLAFALAYATPHPPVLARCWAALSARRRLRLLRHRLRLHADAIGPPAVPALEVFYTAAAAELEAELSGPSCARLRADHDAWRASLPARPAAARDQSGVWSERLGLRPAAAS